MIDKEFSFVLGAQDPEMREIAKVLKTPNRAFVHAAKARVAVSARTAYDADSVVKLSRAGRGMEALLVPQTPALLEMEPTPTQRLIAAADHCLTAAYQGACPGGELLFLRASWRARMSGRSLTDVVDGILHAAKQVRRYYDSEYGESLFLDPTEAPLDLPEGGAYAGHPVRYRALFPGGELKEMLKGASPEHIERFMALHRAQGREVYGNPYRGYAGAYFP